MEITTGLPETQQALQTFDEYLAYLSDQSLIAAEELELAEFSPAFHRVIQGMIDVAEGFSQWTRIFPTEMASTQVLLAEFLSVSQDLAHYQEDPSAKTHLIQYLQTDLLRFLDELRTDGLQILRQGSESTSTPHHE